MLEASVESLLVSEVKALGGEAIKLMPTHAGVPDRLVLLPGGRSFLVELKRAGENPSKIQNLWHARSAARGHPVTVLRGADEVREWVSNVA